MRAIYDQKGGRILVLILVFSMFGCKKYRLNRDTTTSEDYAQAEQRFISAFKKLSIGMKALDSTELKKRARQTYSACVTYRLDTLDESDNWPRRLVLNYGPSNCTGPDGAERRGKVKAVVTGPFLEQSSEIHISFDDFYVNDQQVSADSFVIRNQGRNQDNHRVFSYIVREGEIATDEEHDLELSIDQEYEWVKGLQTDTLSDDVYQLSGTMEGENRKGRSFNAEITQPLTLEMDCQWITKGTLHLQPEDLKERTIDYGDGNCDNEARVKIEDRNYTIKME